MEGALSGRRTKSAVKAAESKKAPLPKHRREGRFLHMDPLSGLLVGVLSHGGKRKHPLRRCAADGLDLVQDQTGDQNVKSRSKDGYRFF